MPIYMSGSLKKMLFCTIFQLTEIYLVLSNSTLAKVLVSVQDEVTTSTHLTKTC